MQPPQDPQLVMLKTMIANQDASFLELKFDSFQTCVGLLTSAEMQSYLQLLQSRPLSQSLCKKMEILAKQIVEIGINDSGIFTEIVNGYGKLQDGKSVEQVVIYVVGKHLQLTENLMLSIIKYYSKNGPLQSSERLIEFYGKSNQVSPELFHYLIDCCGNTKQPWESWRIVKQMEVDGFAINKDVLKRVLQAFAKNGEVKGLEYTVEILKQKNILLTTQFLNTLMHGYKQAKQYKKGINLLISIKLL